MDEEDGRTPTVRVDDVLYTLRLGMEGVADVWDACDNAIKTFRKVPSLRTDGMRRGLSKDV